MKRSAGNTIIAIANYLMQSVSGPSPQALLANPSIHILDNIILQI
jgi:hypothetical protein